MPVSDEKFNFVEQSCKDRAVFLQEVVELFADIENKPEESWNEWLGRRDDFVKRYNEYIEKNTKEYDKVYSGS